MLKIFTVYLYCIARNFRGFRGQSSELARKLKKNKRFFRGVSSQLVNNSRYNNTVFKLHGTLFQVQL